MQYLSAEEEEAKAVRSTVREVTIVLESTS